MTITSSHFIVTPHSWTSTYPATQPTITQSSRSTMTDPPAQPAHGRDKDAGLANPDDVTYTVTAWDVPHDNASYEFRVRATNGAGESDWTTPVWGSWVEPNSGPIIILIGGHLQDQRW